MEVDFSATVRYRMLLHCDFPLYERPRRNYSERYYTQWLFSIICVEVASDFYVVCISGG